MSTPTPDRCAPDDPRADNPTYVAVCRDCGGWSYIADGHLDQEPDCVRDMKKAAAWCVDHNSEFKKVRFGDIDLRCCTCHDKKKTVARPKTRQSKFVPLDMETPR